MKLMSFAFEQHPVPRAESTPDNLRRRGDEHMRRAREADAAGDADGAQAHRNQAFIKYAIAWGLLLSAIAALGAKAAEVW